MSFNYVSVFIFHTVYVRGVKLKKQNRVSSGKEVSCSPPDTSSVPADSLRSYSSCILLR